MNVTIKARARTLQSLEPGEIFSFKYHHNTGKDGQPAVYILLYRGCGQPHTVYYAELGSALQFDSINNSVVVVYELEDVTLKEIG